MPISTRIWSFPNVGRRSDPPSAASLLACWLAGTAAIVLELALGTSVVAYASIVPWIALVFLLGLPLAIAVTRGRPGLFMPAVAIFALTGISPSFVVDTPLWGHTVNLRGVDDIPAGADVAGYIAPGWRVDSAYSLEARLSGGRGNRSYGTRRIAPLVGDGWTPQHPVEVWVAGEVRDSGRILPSHPQFWNQPGREYTRLVGVSVSGAQIEARNAAGKFGLKTSDEPLIVVSVPSVAEAVGDQHEALLRMVRVPMLAWMSCIALAAAIAAWRRRRR